MEEKKLNNEIKMTPENQAKPQKLTYEELNEACADLSQQLQNQNEYIRKMHRQMQDMGIAIQNKRMDYLFKVLEIQASSNTTMVFHDDFIKKCIQEIEESMTIPETEEEPKES